MKSTPKVYSLNSEASIFPTQDVGYGKEMPFELSKCEFTHDSCFEKKWSSLVKSAIAVSSGEFVE
jgi:hypothetical protein